MSGFRTVLATLAVIGLGIGGLVAFELAASPDARQRGAAGTAAFVVGGVLCAGLWAWYFRASDAKRKRAKR